jgi:tetratricopeptide (TPR) repeat protein/DNA-binding transcriptional ArsR family regulator
MSASKTDPTSREASRSIWVFTPSRTAPADLEAILVQRHELLKDAVERVRESALTNHKHHLLFVGPRGCGKTHLVTLIVSRISADAESSQHLRLAWLNEDETCTSLLELLIKVHTALEKRYADEFRATDLAEAYELKPAAALDFVTKRLLGTLGPKTLVIVTENLDALFDSMGQEGQKQLRAFIQEHPQFAIVATAQRLVEDLSDRASPFFGFFQTEHLKPLSVEQATTLLQNIARIQDKPDVTEFLDTSRGRSRVRALHHLSGGNHRIYIVLSQFITRETMDALIGPFLKMVDELTPYYQERVRWLPPLQRKIVEMLCTCETTVPVKEIARRLFSTPQTISSQLQDLREKGYVESSQRGRESLYEISEPLMRICVEVKENQNTQPLRLLVDFLRVWYDDAELKRRRDLSQPETHSYSYLCAALERNAKEGNLRMRMLVEDVLGAEAALFGAENLKQLEARLPEEVLIAFKCHRDGDAEGAHACLAEALKSATTPTAKAEAIFLRGLLHSEEGNSASAIADFTSVIELPGASINQVAQAFFNRGVAHGREGDSKGEIADYTRVIELPDASTDQVTMALYNRGVAHVLQGDRAAAITDYTRVIELPGAPTDTVAWALFNRGCSHGEDDNREEEIADFTRVIELPGAPTDQVSKALLLRGVAHFQSGKKSACREDLEALIRMADAPAKPVIDAYIFLAGLHFSEGRWPKGFEVMDACLSFESQQSVSAFEAPVHIMGVLFTAGLSQEGRITHAGSLLRRYTKYSALAVLGEALVKHLGSVFLKGELWPSSDNLDQWLIAWERAAGDAAEFKLPLRLLRVGIEFIKSGGKDHGILLNLTAPERSLLRQAFGLDRSEN